MSALLTIAIPTYNRAELLRAQLERLRPQLNDRVVCWIYDNCSSDHTAAVAREFASDRIFYYRAAVNGGMCRNFLRCFEECQTKWLWVLSDDDPASATAIADLLAVLEGQTADFIHTSMRGAAYAANTEVTDVKTLIRLAGFNMIYWLSSGIYRTKSFHPYLRIFNESLSTWCPQGIALLALLESGNGKVLLSSVNLIGASGGKQGWSTLEMLIRASMTPEYLRVPEHRQLLAQVTYQESFMACMLVGLREARQPVEIQRWKRIFRQSQTNLRAYQAHGPYTYLVRNWYRAGRRKQAWRHFFSYTLLLILWVTPDCCFQRVASWMPLSGYAREEFQAREKFDARD